MELLQQFFDPYEIKGRIFPPLLALLPLGLSAILWYPNLLDSINTSLTLLCLVIILGVLSKFSRDMGFRSQKLLLKEWGGFPTTIMIRHRDHTINFITKERYHSFLREKISNIRIPTKEQELEQPDHYDMHYDSAIAWLREYTRDKTIYSILHIDNANYGFSRNTYGMKRFGLSLCLLSLALNILGLYEKYGLDIKLIPFKFWVSMSVSILITFIWIFMINKEWVRNYADVYARSLLAACEKK